MWSWDYADPVRIRATGTLRFIYARICYRESYEHLLLVECNCMGRHLFWVQSEWCAYDQMRLEHASSTWSCVESCKIAGRTYSRCDVETKRIPLALGQQELAFKQRGDCLRLRGYTIYSCETVQYWFMLWRWSMIVCPLGYLWTSDTQAEDCHFTK